MQMEKQEKSGADTVPQHQSSDTECLPKDKATQPWAAPGTVATTNTHVQTYFFQYHIK